MGARLEWLEVEARAERRQNHPTVITAIELLYRLRGEGVDGEMVERAVRMAEEQLCPMLAMLQPGTAISSCWQLD